MILPALSASELESRLGAVGASPLQSVVPLPDGRVFAQSASIAPPMPTVPYGLSDEQSAVVRAVTNEDTDTLVIAGPGSGKTRTLIASIVAAVQAGVPPETIAAITFTNNGAAEMQVRLVEKATELALPALQRVHVSTFHAWVGQLAAGEITQWTYPPVRLGTAGLAVALHLTNPGAATHVFTKPEVAAADRHLEGSESFTDMEARNFNRIGAKDSPGTNRIGFDHLVEATKDLTQKLDENQIDSYGTLMAAGTGLASKLAPESLTRLFLDEAQDINAPQATFVDAVQNRTGCRLFVIADDDQGIYKFRGASNKFLREFGERRTTKKLSLSENFRSTKPIVNVCRNWIEPNWNALGSPAKTLHSNREGLPVILLTAWSAEDRGRHAEIIIDAARKVGLINAYGEVASFGFSPSNPSFDLQKSGLPHKILNYLSLPDVVLQQWLDLCRVRKATGDWHHALWKEFLVACTADQKAKGDAVLGHPGLNELYASLETIRRLQPGLPSDAAAKVFLDINPPSRTKPFEKFAFTGERMPASYTDDEINHLSLHSCKGMEFPLVWLSGCGFAYSVKAGDTQQGQPNLLGELGEWAKKTDRTISKVTGASGQLDPEKSNQFAAELENRRLLYVGMSRATDLLLVSAPAPNKRSKADDNAFHAALHSILPAGSFREITWDNQAEDFARSLCQSHRNPTWTPPHRYRVESFTSLTRQPLPGEDREVEIPREREFPLPQSRAAMIGDLFHRIMHLLCLEPETREKRLANILTNADLIARVSTRDPATELAPLAKLLENYFSDTTNQPWTWLANSRSEVPFSHVVKDKAGATCLLKGYIDLVGFDAGGTPNLIVDYKTGPAPTAGSPEDTEHADQLHLYRDALATTHACDPEEIAINDYYVGSKELRDRDTPPAPPQPAPSPSPPAQPSPACQVTPSTPSGDPSITIDAADLAVTWLNGHTHCALTLKKSQWEKLCNWLASGEGKLVIKDTKEQLLCDGFPNSKALRIQGNYWRSKDPRQLKTEIERMLHASESPELAADTTVDQSNADKKDE